VGNGWERIEETLNKEEANQRLEEPDLQAARDAYTSHATLVRWITLAMTLLSILWEIMLGSTILYFHNLPQKIVGALFAILGWALTYRCWYKMDVSWSPGLPGQGKFKYLKD